MRAKEKEKMCPFCEGSVVWDATECKYCGSSLVKGSRKAAAYQTQDSLASLYEPPYAPNKKSSQFGIPQTEPAVSHYSDQEEEAPPQTTSKRKDPKDAREEEEENASLGSLLLLSLGGVLFTLSWLLFFFSDQGRVVLEWKSKFWFVYLLASLPLIYKGYKKLK